MKKRIVKITDEFGKVYYKRQILRGWLIFKLWIDEKFLFCEFDYKKGDIKGRLISLNERYSIKFTSIDLAITYSHPICKDVEYEGIKIINRVSLDDEMFFIPLHKSFQIEYWKGNERYYAYSRYDSLENAKASIDRVSKSKKECICL